MNSDPYTYTNIRVLQRVQATAGDAVPPRQAPARTMTSSAYAHNREPAAPRMAAPVFSSSALLRLCTSVTPLPMNVHDECDTFTFARGTRFEL